jgi:hypothetical protein
MHGANPEQTVQAEIIHLLPVGQVDGFSSVAVAASRFHRFLVVGRGVRWPVMTGTTTAKITRILLRRILDSLPGFDSDCEGLAL